MAQSQRLKGTARGAVLLLAVLLLTTACRHITPSVGNANQAPGTSTRGPVQLAAPGVGSDGMQRIQISGPDSAHVIAIAREVASTLKLQPRVADTDSVFVAVPLDPGGTQFALNVTYQFRGPAKLADNVRVSIASGVKVPDGYQVLASATPRGS